MKSLFWALMAMSLYGGGLIGGGLVLALISGWSPFVTKLVGLGLIGICFVMQIIVALKRRGLLK